MVADKPDSSKKVSTSELIDWVKMLKKQFHDAGKPLPQLTAELLFPSVLLKNRDDYNRYTGGTAPPTAGDAETDA